MRNIISSVRANRVTLDTGRIEKTITIEIVDADARGQSWPTVVHLDLMKAGLLAATIEKEIKDLDETYWKKLYGPTDNES